MQESYLLEKENPTHKTNFFSKLFFLWMFQVIKKVKRKGLEINDLYQIDNHSDSAKLGHLFEHLWHKEIRLAKSRKRKPSLWKVIFRGFCREFFVAMVLFFINIIIIRSMQPFFLARLLECFHKKQTQIVLMFSYGTALCLLIFVSVVMLHHSFWISNLTGMKIRIALSSLVYRKILKLSQLSLTQTSPGQVINLLSNDVARFDVAVPFMHFIWITPMQLLLISYWMWRDSGSPSTYGILCMTILTLPTIFALGISASSLRKEFAKKTDHRVQVMNELVSGINVIKMYAWEKPFENIVNKARKEETKCLFKTNLLRAILTSFMSFVERSAVATTLLSFLYITGENITAPLVFSSLIYFNMLQLTLAMLFPLGVFYAAETAVSIKRLKTFLLMEEKKKSKLLPSGDGNIHLMHVETSWVSETPILRNLNLIVPSGYLCAVVGPVGCGKSSFLKLLLGELLAESGVIKLSGSISYASQEPWIFTSSIRNNILFGQTYNLFRYAAVVDACALNKDINTFPNRDGMILKDGGGSLSGGQRARINLARTIYQNSDIYLLDDPLSAVDAEVGNQIFHQCVMEFLRGKTRFLATHQLQYLKQANMIIFLNKGTIQAVGTFSELSSRKDLNFFHVIEESEEFVETRRKFKPATSEISLKQIKKRKFKRRDSSVENILNDQIEVEEDFQDEVKNKPLALLTYMKYCRSIILSLIVVLGFILVQLLISGIDYWLTLWTSQHDTEHDQPLQRNETLVSTGEWIDEIIVDGKKEIVVKRSLRIVVYLSLLGGIIVITLARSILFFYCCMRSSIYLHEAMFHSLLESPIKFFNTYSIGFIMNTFSKDIGSVDEQLPKALMDVYQILLSLFGYCVLILISNYFMAFIIVITIGLFVYVRLWFIQTIVHMKHVEAKAKSPVFEYISATMEGIITIRSTKNEKTLIDQFDGHQNVHTSAWYLTITSLETFGMWLDLICVIFVTCVIILMSLVDVLSSNVGGSYAGLAISQSIKLIGMLQYWMTQCAQVAIYVTSVERILAFTKLEKEYPFETPKGNMPKKPWPSKGKIEFINLSLSYDDPSAPSLQDMNLVIRAKEKVGIVGRTAAGKSTIFAALFRLAPITGDILIDHVNIRTIGLTDLRRKITIIPQEPVLFSASIRYNLDPFNEFRDSKLWRALDDVELKAKIDSLEFLVTEGGSNFSVGQRQLICLARAILRNNRILILDEATANVDLQTDELIQETIRSKFAHCTVLTIAHRLNTVIDSDKILVMDKGRKVEFDHPYILLQNREGHLSKMVQETGPSMAKLLYINASTSYSKYKNKDGKNR